MIKRANMVKLVTTGGYNCLVVAVDFRMSEKELKKILSEHEGKDHSEYCWFDNQQSYNSAKKALTD